MKRSIGILILSLCSVFIVAGHPPDAAEQNKYPTILYDIEPIDSEVADRWQEVLKSYPAAAMVWMCQEVAQASLAYHPVEDAETLPTYVNVGSTPLGSAIEDTLRLKSCIDKFIRCDMRAVSDGVVSIDEIHGCSTSFSNCWTRQKK